jgi:NADH dehydrogenase/NADH:ubiquinone oxidoreductase subunit G
MIRLTIDNRYITVPSGYTVLQAARDAKGGIAIPTLCYLETLAPYVAWGGIG